ncbi:MAG: T9SS type A sorting domain-containing protein [Candidatus Eisenbacteria bacterium]
MRIARCFLAVLAVAVLVLTIASAALCQWVQSGLSGSQVMDVAFRAGDSDTAYATHYYNTEGVYKSIDGGLTWLLVKDFEWAYKLAVDPINKDAVYAIFSDAIFRTLDGGTTWQRKDSGFNFNADYSPSDIAVNPAHPESVYVTTSNFVGGGGFYCSPDQGDNWNHIEMPWLGRKGVIGLDPLNTARIFVAARSNKQLGRALDGGTAWEGVLSETVNDLAINPENPDIVYTVTSLDSAVFRSIDGGETWATFGSEAGLGIFANVVAVNPVNPAVVYAGGQGVYRSVDGGTTWADYSTGLPGDAYITSIEADGEFGTTLLLGTYDYGIYRRSETLSGVEPKSESGRLVLTAGPNPFRSQTIISYEIPKAAQTHIAVYNVSGREVSTLMNRSEAAGKHQASWNGRDRNGSQVGPGIYFVKIRSGQASAVKAIVLFR